VAAGDVVDQRAKGGGRRRGLQGSAQALGGGEAAGQQAGGGALDIAFDPGHLAREAQARGDLHPQGPVQQARAVDEGVAVQPAQPGELGVGEARDHPEHLGLGPVFQLGLEAHHVPQRAQGVVLAQLDDGVGLDQRVARIGQDHRLHGSVAEGLAAAPGHYLDRQ